MRDPKRIPKFLDELKGIWGAFPEIRFGQLMVNVMRSESDISAMDAERKLYYMEDKELIKAIRKYSSEVKYIAHNKPDI